MNSQTSQSHGALAGSYRLLNQPADEYHAQVDIQSCSLLKPLMDSPAAYRSALLSPQRASTPEMDYGTLLHMLVLEPRTFAAEVSIYPDAKTDGRDKAFNEFKLLSGNRLVIDEPTLQTLKDDADKLFHQPVLGRRFGDFVETGLAEVTYYYTDPATGVRCRCRMDLDHPEAIFDIKTTSKTGAAWLRQALQLSYDMQAYMYSLAECLYAGRETPKPFVFMCIETEQTGGTYARRAGSTFMEQGGRKYQHALSTFAACMRADYWPAASGEEVIEIDHWQQYTPTRDWLRPPVTV